MYNDLQWYKLVIGFLLIIGSSLLQFFACFSVFLRMDVSSFRLKPLTGCLCHALDKPLQNNPEAYIVIVKCKQLIKAFLWGTPFARICFGSGVVCVLG